MFYSIINYIIGVIQTFNSYYFTKNYDYHEEKIYHTQDNLGNCSVLWYANYNSNSKYMYLIQPGGMSNGYAPCIKYFVSKLPNVMMCIIHKPGVLTKTNKLTHVNDTMYINDIYSHLLNKFKNTKICLLGFSAGGNCMIRYQQLLNFNACVSIDYPVSLIDTFKTMRKRFFRFDILSSWIIYNSLKNNVNIKKPNLQGYDYLCNYLSSFTNSSVNEYIEKYKILNIKPKNTLVIISKNDPVIYYKNDNRCGSTTWKFNYGGHCGSLYWYPYLIKNIDTWVKYKLKLIKI